MRKFVGRGVVLYCGLFFLEGDEGIYRFYCVCWRYFYFVIIIVIKIRREFLENLVLFIEIYRFE